MHTDTQAQDLNGAPQLLRLDRLPDSCPLCHRSVHPKLVSCRIHLDRASSRVVFQCTHHQCQELFVSIYSAADRGAGRLECIYLFSAPKLPVHHNFPDVIQNLSPNFCLIFSQSEHAESERLDQLVGIGLRKALEFLVKDFAISENPAKVDEIQKTLLGPCIDKYINDVNVKECAKRAAWLGNDETHYVRKWGDKDIADLKLLVRLTVNWLESHLLTKQYIASMPSS